MANEQKQVKQETAYYSALHVTIALVCKPGI